MITPGGYWATSNDRTAIYYAEIRSAYGSHHEPRWVVTIEQNLDFALDDASDLHGAPLEAIDSADEATAIPAAMRSKLGNPTPEALYTLRVCESGDAP